MGSQSQSLVRGTRTGPAQGPIVNLTVSVALGSNEPKVYGLGGGSAITVTIDAPIPGVDDGKVLEFVSTTAFAHIVMGPANCFNGDFDTATIT